MSEMYAGNVRSHVGVIKGPGAKDSWRCPHQHPNAASANSCANEELARRRFAANRRSTVRLPGIHADIVLEHMSTHPGTGGEGVEMTICASLPPLGNPNSASVELSLSGVKDLIAGLTEVAGLQITL